MAPQYEHTFGHLQPGYHHTPARTPTHPSSPSPPTRTPARPSTRPRIHWPFQEIQPGGVRQYGQDMLICGFWWAFAQAVKIQKAGGQTPGEDKQEEEVVKGFENLCLSALGDYKFFTSEEQVQQASFQAIEDSEEQRAHNGFTGFRKILLVSWAHGVLKKRSGGNEKAVTHDLVAQYLGTSLKFHDEKQKPTGNSVRDLLQLVKHLLKNSRVIASRLRKCFGVVTPYSMITQSSPRL